MERGHGAQESRRQWKTRQVPFAVRDQSRLERVRGGASHRSQLPSASGLPSRIGSCNWMWGGYGGPEAMPRTKNFSP